MDTEFLTSEDWGSLQSPQLSKRMVARYASEGRIKGAKKFGNENSPRSHWMIPKSAKIEKLKRGARIGNQNAKKNENDLVK